MATILVTDDTAFLRNVTCDFLHNAGYETIQALNGQDCLDKLEEHSPDCIFLDLIMPGMSGFEVLEHLKEKSEVPPIIILSSIMQKNTREQCFALGAFDFLKKPPVEKEVLAALEKALGNKG